MDYSKLSTTQLIDRLKEQKRYIDKLLSENERYQVSALRLTDKYKFMNEHFTKSSSEIEKLRIENSLLKRELEKLRFEVIKLGGINGTKEEEG